MGFDMSSKTTGITASDEQSGPKSGPLSAVFAPVAASAVVDPDLARINAAWPSLSDPIRRAMLALIGSVTAVVEPIPAGQPDGP